MVTEEEQLIVGMEVEVEMWEGVGASEGEEVCIPLLGEAMGVPVAAGALGVPASKGALGVPAALAVKASVAAAQMVGKLVAEKAKAAGIEKVAFDRAGFAYHGRVKALADAAREAGLQF
jgi:hypothetical protein